MSAGIQLPGKGTKNDVLNTAEYADLQWLVYDNDGTVEIHPVYGQSSDPNPTIPIWAANTDWYDAMTDPAGIMYHDLTLSGGSENAKFYAGFGALNQKGIIIYTHNTRYSARINSDFKFLKNRVRAGENLGFSYRNYLVVPNLNERSPIQLGPYRSQSIMPVTWTDPDFAGMYHTFTEGDWGGTGISSRLGTAPNVVADLTRNKDDYFRDLRLTGSVYLDAVIMEGLNFRSTLGGTWDKGSLSDYTYPTYERFDNIPDTTLVESRAYNSDWIWTNSLVFNRQPGQHKITAILGYEAVNYNIGRVESNLDSTEYTPTRLLSTFIKADYSFMDRYLLSATLRRDGCSRFSESNRYGILPCEDW